MTYRIRMHNQALNFDHSKFNRDVGYFVVVDLDYLQSLCLSSLILPFQEEMSRKFHQMIVSDWECLKPCKRLTCSTIFIERIELRQRFDLVIIQSQLLDVGQIPEEVIRQLGYLVMTKIQNFQIVITFDLLHWHVCEALKSLSDFKNVSIQSHWLASVECGSAHWDFISAFDIAMSFLSLIDSQVHRVIRSLLFLYWANKRYLNWFIREVFAFFTDDHS